MIGFVGLGAMGAPMAGHLAAAGHRLVVHNRTRAKAEAVAQRWPDHIGVVEHPADVGRAGADVVITCVGDDDDLDAVLDGSHGVAGTLAAGALVIDHTTASPELARRRAVALADRGIAFVDAPVSGGTNGAEAGTLAVMAGGEPEAVERARPVVMHYAARFVHVGPPGAGQATKLVNQVCIAGVIQGLAEGLVLAAAEGLDLERVLEAIGSGAAGSWQLTHRAPFMVAGDYPAGFASRLMLKDVRLALAEAERLGLSTPMVELARRRYEQLVGDGFGHEDSSALHRTVPISPPAAG